MTNQYRKYSSLNQASATDDNKRLGLRSSKPLTRASSTGSLHANPFSPSSDLRSSNNLGFPVEAGQIQSKTWSILDYEGYKAKRQTLVARGRVAYSDYYSSDTDNSFNSRLDVKSERRSGFISSSTSHFTRSPRQSISFINPKYSSISTNIPVGFNQNSDHYPKPVPSSANGLISSRATLHRSQSSTDLASLLAQSSENSWDSPALNRSWSYSNLNKPTIDHASDKLHSGSSHTVSSSDNSWNSPALTRSWSYSNLNEAAHERTNEKVHTESSLQTVYSASSEKSWRQSPALTRSSSYSNLNEATRDHTNNKVHSGSPQTVYPASSDKSWQTPALNRSWSYSNLNDVTHHSNQDKTDRSHSPQRVHSARTSNSREKRSFHWTSIPSFEEFRKMRAQSKDCSKESDQDNTVIKSRYLTAGGTARGEKTINFSQTTSQPVEKMKPSLSSNPVIQELLVKYGLHKSIDTTVGPSHCAESISSSTSNTTTAPISIATEVASSKQRLLSIVDDFLASRNKARPLSSCGEITSERNPPLRERRTASAPRMTCFEQYQKPDLNKLDIQNECGIPNSEDKHGSSDGGDKRRREYVMERINVQDSSQQRQITDSKRTIDETLKCPNETDSVKPREKTERRSKRKKAKKEIARSRTSTTWRPIISLQRSSDDDASLSDVPEGYVMTSAVTSPSMTPSGTASSSVTSPSITVTSPSITVTSPAVSQRKVSWTSVSECNREESNDQCRRSLTPEPRNLNSDFGKSNESLYRTSSLLSLTDSMTSCEDLRVLDDESPRIDGGFPRTSPRQERSSSRRDSFLSAVGSSAGLLRTGSNYSVISRGSSFLSSISTDSGSLHLEFLDSDDEDGHVFDGAPDVAHEKPESEIKRNDSGLGDEIGTTPCRLKMRLDDIVDDSSRQWSIVASSARHWRDTTTRKKEKRLQHESTEESIDGGGKIAQERQPSSIVCPDCGLHFIVEKETPSVFSEGPRRLLICYKCQSHRIERKEAIIELIHTEINYGKDFQILKEEFLSPMQSGGIVSPDNLGKIFLNIQELLDVSTKFCRRIEDSMQECIGINDEEFCHMKVGKIFVENVEFFQAYELYCCKQPDAISTLESLQKKNELLKVFLNVTCRENPKCRKMDINSFLLAPVQRVMKYPLLLTRIRKATPHWHDDREDLKLAQRKVEDQISKINSLTKSSEVKTKKFPSNLGTSDSVDFQRLKRLACGVLGWTIDEIQLLMHDVLTVSCWEFGVAQSWTKRVLKRNIETHVLFCIRGQNEPITVDSEDDDTLQFPNVSEVSDASLLLLKCKSNGKYRQFRDEIKLRDCVIYNEEENNSFGVVQMGKEAFVFTAKTTKVACRWLKHLKLQTKDQGKWRRRRNASANIMLKTS